MYLMICKAVDMATHPMLNNDKKTTTPKQTHCILNKLLRRVIQHDL